MGKRSVRAFAVVANDRGNKNTNVLEYGSVYLLSNARVANATEGQRVFYGNKNNEEKHSKRSNRYLPAWCIKQSLMQTPPD